MNVNSSAFILYSSLLYISLIHNKNLIYTAMKKNLTKEEIDALIIELRKLTKVNAHTEARLLIAKTFELPTESNELEKLFDLHIKQGHLTFYQIEDRAKLFDKMLYDIKSEYGAVIAKRIYSMT